MEVGMALAIKTLADDFQPLSEVYKSFTDEAVLAEDLGFDYISTSEHHFEDDAWSPSQLPILANIAGRTSRIRLHTNVFLLPLHHPLRVGRRGDRRPAVERSPRPHLRHRLGGGGVRRVGIDPRTRWGRFWEEMEILRLDGPEPFTFEGKHFTIPKPIRQTTKPVQDPFPLWVGGLGSKLQYNSGKRGFHAQGGPVFRPEYLEGLKEAGIDPMTRNLAMFVSGHLADTKEQAWDECKVGWWNWQNEYRKRTWIAMLDSPMKAVPPSRRSTSSINRPKGSWRRCSAHLTTSSAPSCDARRRAMHALLFRVPRGGGGMPDGVVRPGIELFA